MLVTSLKKAVQSRRVLPCVLRSVTDLLQLQNDIVALDVKHDDGRLELAKLSDTK